MMRTAMRLLSTLVAVAMFGTNLFVPSPVQAAEQVAEVLAKAREALGKKGLESLTTLTAEGRFRRATGSETFGDLEGTVSLTLGLPGRIRHEEELSLATGARVTRVAGMNGDHFWEDTATRGTAGGQIVIRGSGPTFAERQADPEQARQMQQRRVAALYERMVLALFAVGDGLSYAGVADVGDGHAHVLEKTDPTGHPLRLFISQDTHMPIAISYMEVRPGAGSGPTGMVGAGGPGGAAGLGGGRDRTGPPPAGEVRRQLQAPPPSTVLVRLEDHRTVDGIQLPHLFVQLVDGRPTEEWIIRRYQVNPRLRVDVFDKK